MSNDRVSARIVQSDVSYCGRFRLRTATQGGLPDTPTYINRATVWMTAYIACNADMHALLSASRHFRRDAFATKEGNETNKNYSQRGLSTPLMLHVCYV